MRVSELESSKRGRGRKKRSRLGGGEEQVDQRWRCDQGGALTRKTVIGQGYISVVRINVIGWDLWAADNDLGLKYRCVQDPGWVKMASQAYCSARPGCCPWVCFLPFLYPVLNQRVWPLSVAFPRLEDGRHWWVNGGQGREGEAGTSFPPLQLRNLPGSSGCQVGLSSVVPACI